MEARNNMAKKDHTGRNLALGGLVLAAVSYVVGLLTAPKSGKETRGDIRKAALKAKTEAEKKLKQAHTDLNEAIESLEAKAKKSKDGADAEVKKVLKQADTVRQKTREILSAVHEGEAQDKDLDKALTDVKKALAHVKSYIKK